MSISKVWKYKSKSTGDRLGEVVASKGTDIVMTKPEMAKHLLSLCEYEEGSILLEPARGSGAFYDNFPEYCKKEWCEINEGRDFLEWDETNKVDYTISNPPFVPRKLFWQFQQKAMKITKCKIFWLINISCMNVFTPKRLAEMADSGWYITHLHIVSDKRWFGRYVYIEISKNKEKNIITYNKLPF
jgi:hypothetical protein